MLDSERFGIGRREKSWISERPKPVGGRNVGFGGVWNRPAGEMFVAEASEVRGRKKCWIRKRLEPAGGRKVRSGRLRKWTVGRKVGFRSVRNRPAGRFPGSEASDFLKREKTRSPKRGFWTVGREARFRPLRGARAERAAGFRAVGDGWCFRIWPSRRGRYGGGLFFSPPPCGGSGVGGVGSANRSAAR